MVVRPYVVRISCAKMPNSCWGKYVHVAVMWTRDGNVPPQIAATKNYRPVKTWGPCNVGRTHRAADARAVYAADRVAWQCNSEYWGCPVGGA
jgi:hypothetical protein